MRDQEDPAVSVGNISQKREQGGFQFGVQGGRGLVGNHDFGIAGKGEGDGYSLGHSARQFVGVKVRHAVRQVDLIQQRLDFLGRVCRRGELGDRLDKLATDGADRGEKSGRGLRDQADVVAGEGARLVPPIAVLGAVVGNHVLGPARRRRRFLNDARAFHVGRRRHRADDGVRDDGLTAPRFADHRMDFTWAYGEGNVGVRMNPATVCMATTAESPTVAGCRDPNAQILDVDGGDTPFIRGKTFTRGEAFIRSEKHQLDLPFAIVINNGNQRVPHMRHC